ncbi:S9 family peptidase [Streptomyces sp. JJ36]|uniref:alpha/beta hydrolase family protein n=1 Tax=Streptomyces sp. JJ36 TaxID=2736645 RepID=UPI001F0039DD|nr:prolyl oligopeptidase family serine peptidase [Streptomyces sp. JJ36]MCF6524640.1 prolyl oligopeptidase family serine peptidase [Streptomyces sp. JJ36]
MTPPPDRISIRFSEPAGYAAGLVTTEDGGPVPAWWDLRAARPGGPRYRELPSAETTRTQPVPTADGRLLLLRTGADRHELALVDPAEPDRPARTLTVRARGLRLCPSPRQGGLALALETDPHGRTTVWRVRDEPLRLVRAAGLPGRTGAVHWLDTAGRRFGTDLRRDGTTGPVAVDLADGSWAPLPSPPGARAHRLLLTAPGAPEGGLLLVASDASDATRATGGAGGPLRLGVAPSADPADVRFPARLNGMDAAVLPLAADPAGERIALRVTRGAGADLVHYDVAADALSATSLPAGALGPAAAWSAEGLHVAYSHPDHPTDVVTVRQDGSVEPRLRASRPRRAPVRTEWFHGPGGGIPALCHGDWRAGGPLVVALHGGPEAAWQLRYDPLLHRLTAAGCAVVAPNQRGSTGYGPGHAAAIHGAWGGPDLADIRHLVRALRARRGPAAPAPALYGTSYGAFLALLALGTEPDAWSRCAVVAPFLSVARLYAEAGPATRALVDRHAARRDTAGAPDAWALAGHFRAPLLIVHGDRDGNVPVGQSRALRRRLLDLGRREPADFRYAEVRGAGHHPLQTADGPALAARLTGFLTTGAHPPAALPADSRPHPRPGTPPAPPVDDHRTPSRR